MPFYSGQVKCIFIDPPYNTKSAFTHYDDNLEHSVWLSMMYPRFEILRDLLAEDGSIWITLDDNESHYLKIMLDEIFGRKNFVANVVWEKKFSPQNDAKWLSDNHDHILCYAKNKEKWRPNLLSRTADMDLRYKNPDNDPRGVWTSSDLTAQDPFEYGLYEIISPSGKVFVAGNNRHWIYSKEKMQELITDNRVWFGKKGTNKPRLKKFLSDVKQGTTALTIWKHSEVGNNQDAKKEIKSFNADNVFDTPKPEKLIQRILTLATSENDLVLDSFLGSGTTAAVAHKMNRRYIGIEIGEHAKTHVVPRLKKVIEGEQGGISKAVGWQGGGSFRFCELGEEVFDAFGSLNPNIRFEDLAAHIWYLENHFPLQKNTEKSPLVGTFDGKAYYLLYNGILGDKRPQGGNVLTRKLMAELPYFAEFMQQGMDIVVYGEACRLGEAQLAEKKITFKQIPYDVTAR
ncbi:site-specific DNA-methyltransferase [Mannheimia varigena]|uniref:site-specific DNA-methyltransferase n=1 Tax=Mannheimia varigena TaxID=85404 RepID=UPI0003E32524|nr:site-specific DNA-methyltransferase [Mannheimia varigena]AHG77626.1 DNA methylase N-4/N-6 domain protein [Mannheimia varigena USDA-ARS-USMARC-1312]